MICALVNLKKLYVQNAKRADAQCPDSIRRQSHVMRLRCNSSAISLTVMLICHEKASCSILSAYQVPGPAAGGLLTSSLTSKIH